jgi:hypothetical protein
LKTACERSILLMPWAAPHDEFLYLGNRGYGDLDSVPALLLGLRWQAETEPDGVMDCTKAHCLDALCRITGHNAGVNYSDWRRWWDEEGSRLPREAFPLKDWTPPAPVPLPQSEEPQSEEP